MDQSMRPLPIANGVVAVAGGFLLLRNYDKPWTPRLAGLEVAAVTWRDK